jgi:hypothetical protein
MSKIRKKYVTVGIDEKYYSIVNNIDDLYAHAKIDANDSKSGVLSVNKSKMLIEQNSEMGTLPSTIVTTGKELQSFNDPFDDTNTLYYKELTSNSSIGLPLVKVMDGNNDHKGFYITTDEYLISEGKISEDDVSFKSRYRLENTKVFDTPNEYSNDCTSLRNIDKKIDESILKQNRFQELYTPFNENYSNLEIPYVGSDDYKFYNTTVDSDIKENYSLGKQKQIKIVLDFSSSASKDLLLLNTKLTFNKPDLTLDKASFSDTLISTRYVNFMNGSGIAESYSSHFLPTAYWNFENDRWNYLDGAALSYDSSNPPDTNDFPVDTLAEVQYAYLGAKNTSGQSLTISPNFIFNSSKVINSSAIQNKHLDNNFRSVYNKPILTTPAFRNDGSLNASNSGTGYNKTAVSRITNSYGFPYKANWQPSNDHLLDMSKYIRNNFLLEKVVIKGKFSSRGEMPVKKGHFSSGYRESSADISSLNDFGAAYVMKDNHKDYVANSLSFFILNERKGLNYVDQNIIPDSFQSYFFSEQLSSINDDVRNTKGRKLKNYLGSFATYESYQNTLNVYSQIIPTSYLYASDNYNNLSLDNVFSFTSNSNSVNVDIYKNTFHYLDDIDNLDGTTIDVIRYKDLAVWDVDTYDSDLITGGNKKHRIKIESSSSFNTSMGRELVSYSNFLICNKYDDITLDEDVLSNIDGRHIIDTARNSHDLNLNITSAVDFEVKSAIKTIENSDYTDESEYKIKSNLYKEVGVVDEEGSIAKFGIDNNLQVSNDIFSFGTSNAPDGDKVTHIFGIDISSIYTAAERTIPFTIPYYSFTAKINHNNTQKEIKFLIKFSYKNPTINSGSGVYNNRASFDISNDKYVYLQDFIDYSNEIDSNGNHCNVVDLNLRFLDPWDNYNYPGSWILYNRSESANVNEYKNLFDSLSVTLMAESNIDWSSYSYKDKVSSLNKFLMYGLLGRKLWTTDNLETSKQLSHYLSSNNIISIQKETPYSPLITFKETDFDIYSSEDYSNNTITLEKESSLSSTLPDILKDWGGTRGNPETTLNEYFYNINNVLEGKNAGTANNLDITSERVINKEKSTLAKTSFDTLSKSGKILQESNAYIGVDNISYLLKPEDNLVLGVTSNANGEVMPTVVKLHDKLEITLIGRDYIDDSRHKTNESKSVRKIITGDDYIDKSGLNIYQTKNMIYDNVWDKNELLNSKEDFKNNKKVIGKNSSRLFGTYSGIVSYDKMFNSDKAVFKTDSVNPSISSVFLDCLNKEPLYTIDSRDRYEYSKKNNDSNLKLPSYKILLSDTLEAGNLSSYPSRYNKVVTDWHKKYHLKEYSSFFEDRNNTKLVDYSYDKFLSSKNDDNSNYFIYYDTNSYSLGLNYENIKSQEKKSKTISDNESLHYRHYKTLKTYLLPYSKYELVQNAIAIENNSLLANNRFINNDKEIKIDLTNSAFIVQNSYSIQYLAHDIKPEYCSFTADVRNDILGDDANPYSKGWCLVIEIGDSTKNKILDGLDDNSKQLFNSLYVNSPGVPAGGFTIWKKYYKKDIKLAISEYVSGIENIDLEKAVVKNFRLITKTKINDSTNEVTATSFLIAPLYFWETNEIDVRESAGELDYSITKYGRGSELYNPTNKTILPESAWYAKVAEGLGLNTEVDNFPTPVRDISFTIANLVIPYTIDDLQADEATKPFHREIDFYISTIKHKLKDSDNNTYTPSYTQSSSNVDYLNNFYMSDYNKLYYSSETFLDNNFLLEDSQTLDLNDENDPNIFLNEKLYKSNCKKVKGNFLEDTTIDLLYKVNRQYVTLDTTTPPTEPYSIVELKGAVNNFTLFKKNSVKENTLIYTFNNEEKIRVNEEKLYDNIKFSYLDLLYNEKVPYFEINLNSEITITNTIPIIRFNTIPYSHYKLDYVSPVGDVEIADSTGSYDIAANNINTGSPIFKLESTPDGYYSKSQQEGKMLDFFYGFSRGKNRYPIERLDGFKYGVESGSKKSFNFYYSNKKYGNFADKLMGSGNFASIYLDDSGTTKFTWTIDKKFVNEYFQYISSTDDLNTYNIDYHARSSYPYIEDTSHALSQLNTGHALYDESLVNGRF